MSCVIDAEPEIIRVDGNMICPVCKFQFWRHPYSTEVLDYRGEPFVHAGCDGRLLKT